MKTVAEGGDYAHQHGIILHRDFAYNIIDRDDQPHITDFAWPSGSSPPLQAGPAPGSLGTASTSGVELAEAGTQAIFGPRPVPGRSGNRNTGARRGC